MSMPGNRPPVIEHANRKIAALERRADHLRMRLESENRPPSYKNSASADYDRAEMAAIASAVECMKFVRDLT